MTTTAASPPATIPAPRARVRRALGDRLNPILVKEVRQALRGRYFRILFTATLTFATVVGLMVVAFAARGNQESIGVPFFMVMFGCMAAAVHAFTPFWAYLSTSSEWDENTHDLLVLSNLRPRQIVAGKLLSALVQALLYYSTFGPFLVFAFLLNGVDLLSITVILACSLATCAALSLVGIALASLARTRAARGLLMAVFGAGLGILWGAGIGMAGGVVESPQMLRSSEGQVAVLMFLTFAAVVAALFGVVALARFAHEEENRSTGMRALSTAIVVLAGAWSVWLVHEFKEHELAIVMQMIAGCLMLVPWLVFTTEAERLGRRTTKHVTPHRALALLTTPFLPGGGRGVLLLLVHFACAILGAQAALIVDSAPPSAVQETLGVVAVFYGYVLVFIGLPAALGGRVVRTAAGRMRLRVAILIGVPLVIVLPAVLGLLFDVRAWTELEHPLNPIWVMVEMERSSAGGTAFLMAILGVFVAALVTLAANAPRVFDGVREVLAASAAARASERRRQSAHAAP
jgi:hypothetical protein